jgi:hypothetical protein
MDDSPKLQNAKTVHSVGAKWLKPKCLKIT